MTIQNVLNFWFGELDENGCATPEMSERWRAKDPVFDHEIRERFEGLYDDLAADKHEHWLKTLDGLVAYIVVLDQFSRNMFRGTPKMYATDEKVLRVTQAAIAQGTDKKVTFAHRNFLYMPLMHSEELVVQEHCVALYSAWRDELNADQLATNTMRDDVTKRIGFAIRHRDVVARFGRFPHRNDILGRTSTAEEIEFLKLPDSWF